MDPTNIKGGYIPPNTFHPHFNSRLLQSDYDIREVDEYYQRHYNLPDGTDKRVEEDEEED